MMVCHRIVFTPGKAIFDDDRLHVYAIKSDKLKAMSSNNLRASALQVPGIREASTMLATSKTKKPVIRQSKIIHKSPIQHPLTRFVTEEAVAVMFNISVEQIERIECCCHMVYVHGTGVSRFVSYADFPPPIAVTPPNAPDFVRWRKRWRKRWNSRYAPDLWQRFYIYQFQQALDVNELLEWWQVANLIKSVLSLEALQQITLIYHSKKSAWER
jgi:hypothetical protein